MTHETCPLGKGSIVFCEYDALDCMDRPSVSRLDAQLSRRAASEPEHCAMLHAVLGTTGWTEGRRQQLSCSQQVGELIHKFTLDRHPKGPRKPRMATHNDLHSLATLFVSSRNKARTYGYLLGGTDNSVVRGVNDAGDVVGYSAMMNSGDLLQLCRRHQQFRSCGG
jgi:hypothetical protein